jgi:hypothetical protein
VSLDGGRVPLQLLDRRLAQRRTESPRHYPDNDLVEVARAVAWVDGVAGYGTRAYAVAGEGGRCRRARPPAPVVAADTTLDNGRLRLVVDPRGAAASRRPTAGRRPRSWTSRTWATRATSTRTRRPARRSRRSGSPARASRTRGPLRGEIECRYRLRVPAALRPDEPGEPLSPRPARAGRHVELALTVCFTLDAGAAHLGVRVSGGEHGARPPAARTLPHRPRRRRR